MARDVNQDHPPVNDPPGPPATSPASQFVVFGAIGAKYSQVRNLLGQPTSNEMATHDGVGRWQTFDGGQIVWHPDTGAFEVHGDILTRYGQLGGSAWAYPTSDELDVGDGRGRFNRFRNVPGGYDMNIYWTQETGAHEVFGQIFQAYGSLGWQGSFLGYPTTSEMGLPDGGQWQRFEYGDFIWHSDTGAHEVHGAIKDLYHQLGGSAWGYPTTDESTTPDGFGRYNHFWNIEGGYETSIYWTEATGAQPVYGLIRQRWAELGWETCYLKYPTGPEIDWAEGGPGSRQQAFQGGRMVYSAAHNDAAPDPIDLLHDFGKNRELEGWVSVKMYADGRVEHFGHQRATGASSWTFSVTVALTNGTQGVANAWTGEAAGTFESGSRNADWYENSHSPAVARDFWRLQRDGRLEVHRVAEPNLGVLEVINDVGATALKFLLGSGAAVVLGPFGASLVLVGTLAGTVLQGGNIQGGLQLINGTLWLAGPGGTFVALLAGGLGTLMTEERELRQDEKDLAWAVFGDKLDTSRIRITNAAGSEGDNGDRPFVFPRFDGKTTINMGQWEEDPLGMLVGGWFDDAGGTNRQIARGEKFLHELVHAWQIQHGSDEGLVLEGMAKVFGEDYTYVAGKNYEDYDLEPQASIIQDWWGQTYPTYPAGTDFATAANGAASTGHGLFGYVRDYLRTGIGSTV